MVWIRAFSVLAVAGLLAACAAKVPPCPVCYEDEWSRTPFPGQDVREIQPLDAKATMKASAPVLRMGDGRLEQSLGVNTISATDLPAQ